MFDAIDASFDAIDVSFDAINVSFDAIDVLLHAHIAHRMLLLSGSDVSPCAAPPSQRVFQEAVRRGNTKELQSLLQNMTNCEFNVNSFGPEGQTALHQSVIDGNLELVKLLVKFGADIRLANRDGWSALHIAAFGGHQDIVLYLITKAKYSAGAR